MPIIFKNEKKNYIPKQRLQEAIKYGTGCRLGGAVYLPSKPYYDGSAFTFKGAPKLGDYSPISLVNNVIETGKLIKDIAGADTTVDEISKAVSNRGNGQIQSR